MDILKRVRSLFVPPQILTPRGTGLVLAMSRENAEAAGQGFKFVRLWTCRCGANLRIRDKKDRKGGPSNFIPFPPEHPRLAGHSMLPSEHLNWNGMAEERGWKMQDEGDGITCPACLRGLTVREYKDARRRGEIV